jgi:RNase H-fold protein (predicted Holliday junction resolvase)
MGDETSGDKSCTSVENNTNIGIPNSKHNVFNSPKFHNPKSLLKKWQFQIVVGFKVMCAKLFMQKQHTKNVIHELTYKLQVYIHLF